MSDRSVPSRCPSCASRLVVVRLECPCCDAEVTGEFDLCPACRLEPETRKLFDMFLDARGNLRQVQRMLGVSYPTVRQRIEEMFRVLEENDARPDPMEILRRVRSGELPIEEAEELLRGE